MLDPLLNHPEQFDRSKLPLTSGRSLMASPKVIDEICSMRELERLTDLFQYRQPKFDDSRIEVADVRMRGALKTIDPCAVALMQILTSDRSIDFMTELLGERRYPADCQIHRMGVGSQLASHFHGQDDVFAIYHFGHEYIGGRYYEVRGGAQVYPEIEPYSLYVARGSVMHGVEEIRSGERTVIVTSWEPSRFKR